jgi:hypothetical protein
MEQFLPGIVQAIILGTFTVFAIFMAKSLRDKKEAPVSLSRKTRNGANNTASTLDFGLIAGSYAVIFFAVAILDGLFAVLNLGPNDMVGLFVVLDLLTIAAWIRGTNYNIMRAIATFFAVAVTGMAALIISRHMHG